jgi:hypothetical protein
MRKSNRPLVPWERPMAFRRTVAAVIVLLGALFVIRAITSSSQSARDHLSPQRLATSMGTALLHVSTMTFTVPGQIGESAGGSMTVERNGDYQFLGQTALDPLQRGEVRDVGGTFYFRFSKGALYQILTTGSEPLAVNRAQRYVAAIGNRWFTTTNGIATRSGAPATPANARDLFSSLGITQWSQFYKEAPTTNSGVSVVPLATNDITWFIPLSGTPLPNAVSFLDLTDQRVELPFLSDTATINVSYQRMRISAPPTLTHVPPAFAAIWNSQFSQERILNMNPYALLWLALAHHS